jgi:hypothetical protein
MPPELARLPIANRIAGSERYVKKGALGHEFLVEVLSAEYKIEESKAESRESNGEGEEHAKAALYIGDLGTPEKSAEGLAKLREFEASTAEVADLPGVGERAFAVRDSYYGEMIVARAEQFIVIGLSEKAERQAVAELVKAGVASAWARGS